MGAVQRISRDSTNHSKYRLRHCRTGSRRLFKFKYPSYVTVTEELLTLLGNMVEGQSNSYIDDVLKELLALEEWRVHDKEFLKKVTEIIEGRDAGPYIS